MAEEILLLKLQVQTDTKAPKTINDLIKRNKELAKVLKNAPKEGTEAYKDLEKELESARKEYAKNRQEILKFNKELRTGEKEVEATGDSLRGLSKTLKSLEKEYRNLSAEERKTARGRELQKNIIKTRKELLKAEKAIGDFRRQVGNYTRSLVSLNSGIAGVAVSVGQLKTGLGGMVSAFKNAGASAKAFLLTLGPISIAIGLIVAGLSKFQSVIDSVKATLSGVGAVFDVLAERFGRLGLAFSNLLTFDFEGFARDAKNAFSGIGDEIQNDFNQAKGLTEELQRLRDREINNIVRLAEIERDISEEKRKSAELEQKDRRASAQAIERAIALVEEQQKIELGLAREREGILKRQVELSAETTRTEDRKALAEQTANIVRIEKKFNDELRGLIKRRELLNKTQNQGNQQQLSDLEQLQKRQAELTKELKLQILAGDDYTNTLSELRDITQQLVDVDTKFTELLENTKTQTEFASGSIKDYNKQIADLTEQLESVNTESQEYADIQKEIAQLEALRAGALGQIQMSIDELNKAQLENLAILEDSETSLRLRAEALKEIQALEGSSAEIAEKRKEIESNLNADLRQLRINRINDEKELLNQELTEVESNLNDQLEVYADNELKKQELLLIAQGKRDEIRKRELELEKELLDISKKNFDETEKSKTASAKAEEARRKELRDLALETSIEGAKKITELISIIQEQRTQKEAEEIDRREEAELKQADLVGKTEAEKQKIREKFEKEREELERKSANERKAIAISEAIIDIAGAVLKALNSPAPGNLALAVATGALGALQLAIISATNFAEGGLVTPVELESGRIVNTPNIRSLKNGDNILATVRTGEVILNEEQQRLLGGADTFRKIGVPGFARGGKIDMNSIAKSTPFASGGMIPRFTAPVVVARQYQSGGIASFNVVQSVRKSIEAENKILIAGIEQAVFKGSVQGTKLGTESADITNQIKKQNEREARRTQNETF